MAGNGRARLRSIRSGRPPASSGYRRSRDSVPSSATMFSAGRLYLPAASSFPGASATRTMSCRGSLTSAFPGPFAERALLPRQFPVDELGELGDLLLHAFHLAAHVEDDVHAGQIHPELPQVEDRPQSLEILIGVHPGVPLGARGPEESLAFVESERLRVDAADLGDGADHVHAPAAFRAHRESSGRSFSRRASRGDSG